MRFPIHFGGETTIAGHKCNYCKKKPTSPGFVSLCFGKDQDYAKPVIKMDRVPVNMSFGWKVNDELGGGFELVTGTAWGQCIFAFCSSKCLRAFLNGCVDHLEKQMDAAKTKAKPRLQKPYKSRIQGVLPKCFFDMLFA